MSGLKGGITLAGRYLCQRQASDVPGLMEVCSALAKDLPALGKDLESMPCRKKLCHSVDFCLAYQNENKVFIKESIFCRIKAY